MSACDLFYGEATAVHERQGGVMGGHYLYGAMRLIAECPVCSTPERRVFRTPRADWQVLACPECSGVWITPELAREEGLL